jgi:PEP-CTERM motif-containing protein
MVRKQFHIHMFIAVLLAAAPVGRAATIIGGLEDWWGSSGLEKNGDFNDVIFELTGNVTIDAPGGVFNNLTSGMVNQNGTVFWDNPSSDGPNMNIGYLLLDDASFPDLQYLAMPGGGSTNDVTFDATGTVTLTVLGGFTGNLGNTLGWYDLDDPGVLHQLFAVPPDSSRETVSFAPDGAFALYSTDGWGQVYSSVSASNVDASPNQQHFAFFVDPPNTVPEPSTGVLMGMGVALLGFGALRRKKQRKAS